MKRSVFFSWFFSGLVCFSLLASTQAKAQICKAWWAMSLAEKRQAILATAQSYGNGQYVGKECKEWVREVVSRASGGSVVIPANQNDWSWYPSPNVGTYSYCVAYPSAGDIIQMRWRTDPWTTTPHTMIIYATDGGGMYVIDANWYCKSAPQCVYRHYISYADFRAKALAYNVYFIR
jgi:hypothetical protein